MSENVRRLLRLLLRISGDSRGVEVDLRTLSAELAALDARDVHVDVDIDLNGNVPRPWWRRLARWLRGR